MAKQGTNMFWATLMPVFAPQPKDEPLLTYNNGLLMYIRHDQKITFSSSVLEAMEAVAPIVSVGNILKSSTWDGPLIFQNYVLENSALGFQTVTKPISTAEAEKMHNEFLLNSGLYVMQVSSGLLIPNPNYDLSTAVMDSALMGMSMPSGKGVGTTKKELIAITGEEFYQLLLPDTYGFSTTLIYPNQSLVDGIIEKMKKSKKEEDDAKETSFEEFIKALKEGDNPYVDPKDPYPKDPWKKKPDPWGPSPGTPYPGDPPPKPNPYGEPWKKSPWDWGSDDYKKYRDQAKKGLTDAEYKKWVKEQHESYKKYGGSSGASAADQTHKK